MKIAVLLSGGVDSSVALNLLQRDGPHDLKAYYLKIWLEDELAFLGDCPWESDLKFARAVCAQAGVPLEIVPLQTEYREKVVERALRELQAGRTPSPDIFCNQQIKFGEFCERIDGRYDKVASGHYACLEEMNGILFLKRAPDPVKDQTYFLSNLSQEQLRQTLFPIGHLQKHQVRQLAAEFDLPTKDRRDSQGICFLGKINYRDFVKFHLGEQTGDIIELESGAKLGTHKGFWFHTIGQRHGLGLGGGPWYVIEKDTGNNILYISHKEHQQQRCRDSFTVDNINWISGKPGKSHLQVKIRHSPTTVACHIHFLAEDHLQVRLGHPDSGIAAGQHAVFYDEAICLGGGIITEQNKEPQHV
jgi:tRNA (5-methylaminomethyl-2-thiouridylate)-methyltransferase